MCGYGSGAGRWEMVEGGRSRLVVPSRRRSFLGAASGALAERSDQAAHTVGFACAVTWASGRAALAMVVATCNRALSDLLG